MPHLPECLTDEYCRSKLMQQIIELHNQIIDLKRGHKQVPNQKYLMLRVKINQFNNQQTTSK